MDRPSVAAVRRGLLGFYDRERRDLPWRSTQDPYAIWVSEVMLQQTRVDAVIPYYERWMQRFPTVADLAEADRDEVLETWKGLGYYSRARNLQAAARVVRERHGGSLPTSVDELRGLPGVGEYTAGAIASIAYDQPHPAVDGNVRRVLSRLFDLEAPNPSRLRALATDLVDPARPGDFNQALMELGAVVCIPRNPRCPACPLLDECLALMRDTVDLRPPPKRRRTSPHRDYATLVAVTPERESLLVRRPERGLLAGMWEFPAVELDGPPQVTPELESVSHVFSHLRVTYHAFLVRVPQPVDEVKTGPWCVRVDDRERTWAGPDVVERMALPVAQQKIASRVGAALAGSGQERGREP